MADLILTDPLDRALTFHAHTWFGHVLQRHPDMRPHRRLLEEAVRNPGEERWGEER